MMTADQLLHLSLPNKRSELIRGQLIVREPAGGRHGVVAARVAHLLLTHVDRTGAGQVYGAETGFKIATDPDTVRAPDAAFVSAARVQTPEAKGFLPGAPDLAVEVLSPEDRPGEVLEKVSAWLRAGARLVWVIDPERRTARSYSADGTATLIRSDGVLSGEDVLPDFVCAAGCFWPG